MDYIKFFDFEETAEKNQTGYRLLFEIENILRFFIVDTLSKKNSSWWKDFNKTKIIEQTEINITAECNRKLLREKKLEGSSFILMHEIYYTNIMDLNIIVGEHWNDFYSYFGGENKKEFYHKLEFAHRIRNKVMHSKPIANDELSYLHSLLSFLEKIIFNNGKKYNQFLNCFEYSQLIKIFKNELSDHLTQYNKKTLKVFSDEAYKNSIKEWWWHSGVLDIKTDDFETYYTKASNINQRILSKEMGGATEINIKIASWNMEENCRMLLLSL